MAKRATTSKKKAETTAEGVASVTPVRKTVTPRKTTRKAADVAAPVITHEKIAERAYFISLSGTGGNEFENWCRAETELKSEAGI